MRYIIYIITNLINRKIYIGKTTKTLAHRWSVHKAHSKNPKTRKTHLSRALFKYGIENFSIEILECHDCLDQLKKRENELIRDHQSTNPDIGYNLIIESFNDSTLVYLSEDSREQISLASHLNSNLDARSGFRGVFWGNEDGLHNLTPWTVTFKHKKRKIRKRFSSKLEAARAVDRMNLFKYGDKAILNFPELRDDYYKEDLNRFIADMFYKTEPFSRFFGLSKSDDGFLCRVRDGKERVNLGYFADENEAAEVYDKAAFYLYGNDAKLNFPERKDIYRGMDLAAFYLQFKNPLKPRLKESSSKFRGVTKHKQSSDLWCAEFKWAGTRCRKAFKSEEDAARFYDTAAFKYLGYKAKLNFPNEIHT